MFIHSEEWALGQFPHLRGESLARAGGGHMGGLFMTSFLTHGLPAPNREPHARQGTQRNVSPTLSSRAKQPRRRGKRVKNESYSLIQQVSVDRQARVSLFGVHGASLCMEGTKPLVSGGHFISHGKWPREGYVNNKVGYRVLEAFR